MINIDTRLLDYIQEGKITPDELIILLLITKRIGDNKKSWPSIKLLQKESTFGRDKVSRLVNNLVKNGIINKSQQIKKGKFYNNVYKIKTKLLGVYIPADSVELEEEPSTENQSTETQDTENQTLSIDNIISINHPNNVYTTEIEILNYWNSKEISVHKQTTTLLNGIKKALESYTPDKIKLAIDNYSTVYKGTEYYYSYKWKLLNFLKQANALHTFVYCNIADYIANKPFNGLQQPKTKEVLPRVEIPADEKDSVIQSLIGDVFNNPNFQVMQYRWFKDLPQDYIEASLRVFLGDYAKNGKPPSFTTITNFLTGVNTNYIRAKKATGAFYNNDKSTTSTQQATDRAAW